MDCFAEKSAYDEILIFLNFKTRAAVLGL